MKGIVLAGGLGTRLDPLTKATNKHLLPVYDRPMIYYPLQTLRKAGIKDVMVVVSGPHAGDFISILKNGEEFGFDSLQYGYQWKPNGGIADALSIAKNFANGEDIAVILGDNTTDADISEDIRIWKKPISIITNSFSHRAHLFLREVDDPTRYGIVETSSKLDKRGLPAIKSIKEKPRNPVSNLAVTGLYLYDWGVFDYIEKCEPSLRGELEITDVNNFYLKDGHLTYSYLEGYWQDAGTFDSLYEANKHYAESK